MDPLEPQVSHTDLYHKLGKLEGLMETMMASVSTFQIAIKDIHSRIDALEKRQTDLENNKATQSGAINVLTTLGRDFAIPVLAIAITWLVARQAPEVKVEPHELQQYSQEHRSSER